MKRFLSLKLFLFAALALVAGGMNAEEVTETLDFTSSDALTSYGITVPESGKGTYLDDGVEISCTDALSIIPTKGTSTNVCIWHHKSNGLHMRIYKGGTLTVKAAGCTITKMVLTGTSLANSLFTVDSGSYSGASASTTWTGESEYVVFSYDATASGNIQIKTIEVTYEKDESGKSSAGLTVTPTTVSLEEGEEQALTVTTDEGYDGTVTYESSDEGVAKVDANGNITAVGVGEATITVTAPGTETYKEGTKTVTVNVVEYLTYVPATSIVAGKHYIIATTVNDAPYMLDMAATHTATTSTKTYNYPKVNTNGKFDGENLKVASDANDAVVLVIDENGDGYSMLDANGYYLYQDGTFTSMSWQTDVPDAYWTYTFADGATTIASSNNFTVQYNTSYTSYGVYSDVNYTVPTLYILEDDLYGDEYVKVEIGALGYATACFPNGNVDISDSGLTAYQVKSGSMSEGTGELTLKQPEGSVIQQGVGVIFKGDKGTYWVKYTESEANIKSDSFLFGQVEDGLTPTPSSPAVGFGHYFYKLSWASDAEESPENAGFFWGAEDGAAFEMPAGKAYLALLYYIGSDVRSLKIVFADEETTGINQVTRDKGQETSIFDLQGRKLSKVQKGVNIVGGQKVLVK